MSTSFHSGFVAIIGRPNVGKSTLLNRLVGEKVSIVSNKPQTTRSRVMGVMNRNDLQIVFVDTPGIHQARTKLGEYMDASIQEAVKGIDALLFVIDASHVTEQDRRLAMESARRKGTKLFVLNKIDLVPPGALLPLIEEFQSLGYDAYLPVSANTGDGVEELIRELSRRMPEGPKFFPDDMLTDQPERVLCAEIIREKALLHLRDEVPHGVGIEVIKYERRERSTEIDVTMYCEKASHKSIIIGKNGATLKLIGQEARLEMEALFGYHINLQIWVKVRPNWRNSLEDLKTLGYQLNQ